MAVHHMAVHNMACNCKGCELMYVNLEKVTIITTIVSFTLFLETPPIFAP